MSLSSPTETVVGLQSSSVLVHDVCHAASNAPMYQSQTFTEREIHQQAPLDVSTPKTREGVVKPMCPEKGGRRPSTSHAVYAAEVPTPWPVTSRDPARAEKKGRKCVPRQ